MKIDLIRVATPECSAAAEIVRRLHQADYAAAFVGGAVRDLLLGRAPKDIDIVTAAAPEEIAALFPGAKLVGAAFGVTLVPVREFSFEVATAREERGTMDGRHPDEVRFTRDLGVDAARRDFTINAMLYDPETGELTDPAGGVEDLKRGVVRTVGDPAVRFREDFLRMLRAVRFAARLNFTLDGDLRRAIETLAGECARLSGERIRDELTRILLAPNPDLALEMLFDLGILGAVLPEVAALAGVEQPPEFHPEGDVLEHTKLMLRHMTYGDEELAWSILLHDIGKPLTQSRDASGRIRFFDHESRGADMAGPILERLHFSVAARESITGAIRNHMRMSSVPQMRRAKVRQILASPDFRLELELHRIDCLSSNHCFGSWLFLIDTLTAEPELQTLPEPFVRGRDLIALGARPCAKFGEILDLLFDEQLAGTLSDAAGARLRAQDLLRERGLL